MATGLTLADAAYSKVLLHSAKHPWGNVFGILLGDDHEAADAIPLFHTPITAPALEAAMLLVGQLCSQTKKRIVGTYFSGEDDSVPKKVTQQIASKHKTPVYFLSVTRQKIPSDDSPFQLVSPSGSDWKVFKVQVKAESSKNFNERLGRKLADKLVDFDDCLEDVSRDFRNSDLLS